MRANILAAWPRTAHPVHGEKSRTSSNHVLIIAGGPSAKRGPQDGSIKNGLVEELKSIENKNGSHCWLPFQLPRCFPRTRPSPLVAARGLRSRSYFRCWRPMQGQTSSLPRLTPNRSASEYRLSIQLSCSLLR